MSFNKAVLESDREQLSLKIEELVGEANLLLEINNFPHTRPELENLRAAIDQLIDQLLGKIDYNNSLLLHLYRVKGPIEKLIGEYNTFISDGKYFSCLDQVWTSQELSFSNTIVSLFDRTSPPSNSGMPYYKIMMEIEGSRLEIDYANVSRSGSSASQQGLDPDIFGRMTNSAQNAHLMPHAVKVAAKWHLIVPGVLSGKVRGEDDKRMRMFIDGFRIRTDNLSLKRFDNSGIRNFPTNKIRLLNQGTYFDTYHCLLIIPILSPEDIRNWNGGGYEAIVLATSPGSSESPAEVYCRIGACSDRRADEYILATLDEVEKCRNSLEQLILVVVKSYYDLPTKSPSKDVDAKDRASQLAKLEGQLVRTPFVDSSDSSLRRVRKIRFDSFYPTTNEELHRAPDPMLLLSKAVSNWLHMQGIKILPSIKEGTNSETTSMSSYEESSEVSQYVVNNSTCGPNQAPVGQRPKYVDSPPVTEIAFINDGDFSVSSDFN